MINIKDYPKTLQAKGRYSFTVADALKDLQISAPALRAGLYRLKQKSEIISPAKGFYVIVPPEYQSLGSLPSEELIPLLMQHWGIPYYVCLLSAAEYYGAAHQKPQVFQVMVQQQLRPLQVGKLRIEFIYKKNFANDPIQQRVVKSGYLNIASTELTMMDLFLYPHHAGGINHIATVVAELIEAVDCDKMLNLVKVSQQNAWVQRLGYVLQHIDPVDIEKRDQLSKMLQAYVKQINLSPIPLVPGKRMGKINPDWFVIENIEVEADE